jgi:hypothetical protein
MTLEEDPAVRRESEAPAPAPLPAAGGPSRITRSVPGVLFVIILIMTISGAWLGVSSHWQAFSRSAVVALPQSRTGAQRSPPPPAAAPDQTNLAEIKSHLAAIDTRVATLEHSTNAAQPAATSPPDLGTRLDSIDQRLGTVEVQAARAADRDTISSLQGRVARLEAENSGEKLRQSAATLALANLARAAEEGTSFKTQLDALVAVAPNDPALKPLEPLATSGVPTLSVLKLSFPVAARTALNAQRTNTAPTGGFFAQAWARLRSLFSTPAPVATAQADPNADRLARAQADLNRGDLPNAVTETKAVTGPAAMAMAPWVKDAEARLSLDRTLAGMDGRIVQALAQQAPQAAPPTAQGLPTVVPPKARESANAGGTLPVQ